MKKPKVRLQGKLVAQADGAGYLTMLPNGGVKWLADRQQVITLAKKYFKSVAEDSAISVGLIEWRGEFGPEESSFGPTAAEAGAQRGRRRAG
mgnify:CR=1 FL=1